MDSKVFAFSNKKGGEYRIRVSVLETTSPSTALDEGDLLSSSMSDLAGDPEENIDDVILFVVDILNECATVLGSSQNSLGVQLSKIAWSEHIKDSDGNLGILPGIMSRK